MLSDIRYALRILRKNRGFAVVAVARVSGNYFEVLGVGAAVGRLLTPADNVTEGAHPVTVLSWEMWQRRFGGENGVLGRSIALNGVPFKVIGVAARGFHGTQVGTVNDLYVPIMMMPTLNPPARGWNSRHWWWLTVIARMKPGTTLNSASSGQASKPAKQCTAATSSPINQRTKSKS